MPVKICSKCKEEKSFSCFYKSKKGCKHGLSSYCKECYKILRHTRWKRDKEKVKQQYKKWEQNNPDKRKNIQLRNNHGLTLDDYNAMLKNQRGVCAICGRPERIKHKEKIRDLAVDHNHQTGKIRQLLCGNCNYMLGHADENITILQNAITYLLKHE